MNQAADESGLALDRQPRHLDDKQVHRNVRIDEDHRWWPSKFANLEPEQVIRALKNGGFYIHETSGSHVQMKHPTKPGRVTIPYHKRFDLP